MRRVGVLGCLCLLVLVGLSTAQVVVTSSGYATNAGSGASAQASGQLASVPQITFVNTSNAPVGATNGTGNNAVGARNSTIGSIPGVSYASTTVPVYVGGSGTSANQPAPAGVAVQGQPDAEGERIPGVFRTGAMQIESAYAETPDAQSLAQLARESRERVQLAGNIRTYTNEDIQRVDSRSGVSKPAGFTVATTAPNAGGLSGTAALEGNQGSKPPAATATPAAPSNTPTSATTPTTTETTTANEGQNAGKPDEAAAPSRLPGTSSLLPLLALFGALAGGTGAVLRWTR